MQTFLPYPLFTQSAQVLDMRRLGKQRCETLQILKALFDSNYGWQNHPAVKMWRGSESWLIQYGLIICEEWIARGYKDTCYDKIRSFIALCTKEKNGKWPKFLGNKEFHESHQSNLIRKAPEIYLKKFPGVPFTLEYVWPV